MRRPWWSRVLVGILTAIAISLFAIWYALSGTPQYSLYQLAKSIQARDIETAQRYIDLDRVADEATDTFVDFARSEVGSSGVQGFGQDLAQGLIELMLPALKARVRDKFRTQLRKAIEEGNTETRFFSIPSQVADIRARVQVEKNGKTATVKVTDGKKVISKFRMAQKPDRRWQIVALDRDWLSSVLRETRTQKVDAPGETTPKGERPNIDCASYRTSESGVREYLMRTCPTCCPELR